MTTAQKLFLLVLVLLLSWVGYRQHSAGRLQAQVTQEEADQRRFLSRLTEVAQDNQPMAPDPKPDTSGWMAAQALTGLERRLITNAPSSGGAGAEVKLRKLNSTEVMQLLGQLTKVNLIVRRLELSDLGSRSEWDVHLMVEVPSPEKVPK
jgi:hypothetical protein